MLASLYTHGGVSEQGSLMGQKTGQRLGARDHCGTPSRQETVRSQWSRGDGGGFMNQKSFKMIALFPGTGKKGDPAEKAA